MAYKTVDEYIESFPEEKQKLLKQVRRIVKKNAPGAEEGMATEYRHIKRTESP